MELQVIVDISVFEEICKYSSQYASYSIAPEKWVESMGYLFCKNPEKGDTKYLVEEAVGMASGSEMRVEIPPNELAQIEGMLDSRTDKFLGGWWHTHPGLGLFYSETDITNQMFYQQHNEQGLGIVFDLTLISEDFIGFKIFRLESANSKSYKEIDYNLRGFTKEKMEKALQHIGPLPDYLVHNLCVNLGVLNEEPIELNEFKIPQSTNPMKDASNYYGRAKVKQVRQQYSEAIDNMRMAASLYEEVKKYNLAIDSILNAVDYTIKSNDLGLGFRLMNLVDNYLNILEDQEKNDEYSEYNAKVKYKMAVLYEKIENFGLAELMIEECLKFYDEEDLEEVLEATEKKARYLEKLGYNNGAIKAYNDAIRYAKDIRNSEYVDDIEEFDKRIKDFEETIGSLKTQIKNDGLTRIV